MKYRRPWNEILRSPPEADGGAPPSDAPAPEPDAAPVEGDPPADTGPDFSFIPDDYRGEDGNLDLDRFKTDYEDMLADKAQRAEAETLVPENGEYDFSLPDDLDFGDMELPKNFAVDLAVDDEDFKPIFGEFAELLKDLKAPGDVSKKAMSVLAKYEAAKYSKQYRAAQAEFSKLGANKAQQEARLNRVLRAMETRLPVEQVSALAGAASTYDGVRALEALFSPRGPGSDVPRTPTGEMTEEQRLQSRYSNTKR